MGSSSSKSSVKNPRLGGGYATRPHAGGIGFVHYTNGVYLGALTSVVGGGGVGTPMRKGDLSG